MKHSLRALLRRPGYSGTAVVVLACAIGASTAVFAIVDAVLVRPMPVAGQARLAVLWAAEPEHPLVEISYPDFLDFRDETRTFQDLAAHGSTPWPMLMTGVGDAVRLSFTAVSGSFFSVLGARAEIGRTLNEADEAPGAPRAAVLSHALWQQRFGGDPSVVGRVVSLDEQPCTVVGVMPSRFDYPAGTQLWAPLKLTIDGLSADARENLRRIGFLYMLGRLAPGATPQQAADDANAMFRRLFDRYRFWDSERRAVITPLVNHVLGRTRPALVLLGTAAGLVLLLACINVSGLALVRASSRRTEIAVRYALGASRSSILALLLGEAVLLCAGALALAIPIAFGCLQFFTALSPSGAAGIEDASIGGRGLAFALAAAAVAAAFATVQPLGSLAFGRPLGARRLRWLAPRRAIGADRVATRGFASSLAAGRGSTRSGPGRQAIIAAEVALTLTVLTAAVLAVRSFWNLRSADLGYEADRVLLVETEGPGQGRIGEVLAGLPGVRAVGAVSLRPLTLGPIGDDAGFQLESQSLTEARGNPSLNYLRATPGYFGAMGIRLLAGRGFEERDIDAPAPVAIVSEVTARQIWGTSDVVGKKIRIFRLAPEVPLTTIIGVVGSVRHRQVHETRLDYYVPTRDASSWAVRTAGDPAGLAGAVRTLIRQIDPDRPVETATLSSLVSTAQRPWEFTALVLAAFAGLALLLAATAVHGLVAYAVSLRTNEFGIRVALGATPLDIVWLVFRSTGGVALIGLAIGLLGALAAARAMRSLLFEVSSLDTVSILAALAVLLIALAGACLMPSRRAATVDPMTALRTV